MSEPFFVQRNLPHFYPIGADYFITYRLANSIPAIKINELKENYKSDRTPDILLNKHFARFEEVLDRCTNEPYWLQEDRIAGIVADSLFFIDGKKFRLDCFSIMPNHVHILITHFASAPLLPFIMRDHKGYTARQCNKVLGRTGSFWQKESYDRVVRTMFEFNELRHYILNNPVKAGFVPKWQDWKWNYWKA